MTTDDCIKLSNKIFLKTKNITSPLLRNYIENFSEEIIKIVDNNSRTKTVNLNIIDLLRIIKRNLEEILNSISTKRNSTTKLDYDLVFIILFENHYKQFKVLRRELDNNNISYCCLFTKEGEYHKHSKEINTFYLYDYCTIKNLIGSCCKLIKSNTKLACTKFFKKSLNFSSKENSQVKSHLIKLNSKFLLNLYKSESCLKNLKSHLNRKAIFFKAEGYEVRNLINLFNNMGIETMSIQHGSIGKHHKFSNLNVNKYLVWSDKFGQRLIESNFKSNYIPVGCPAYDSYFNIDRQSDYEKKTDLLFLPNPGVSETPESEVEYALKMCCDYATRFNKFRLFIKAHPGGDQKILEDYVDKLDTKNIVVLDKQSKIEYHKYLFVFTMNSTVGLDCAVHKVPIIIVLSHIKYLFVHDYIRGGIGELATSMNDMIEKTNKIINNYKKYQSRCIKYVDEYLCCRGYSVNTIISLLASDDK